MNRFKHTVDTEAGFLFIVIGIITVFMSSGYRFGDPSRMGPGFFPVVLGGLLVVLGAAICLAGMRSGGARPERFDWKSVAIISGSIVAFGFLLINAGFLIAVPLSIVLASFVQPKIRWAQTLALAAGLTLFAYLVFILGLELRIPLFPEFF